MSAPSAAADQQAAGAASADDPAGAGRRLAASVAKPALNGHEPVEALARASLPALKEMGVHAEIVRARRDCLVVRSSAKEQGDAADACAMVGAWLEALPSVAYGVTGTVAESSCVLRGGRACIHALMWRATGGAGLSMLGVSGPVKAPTSEPVEVVDQGHVTQVRGVRAVPELPDARQVSELRSSPASRPTSAPTSHPAPAPAPASRPAPAPRVAPPPAPSSGGGPSATAPGKRQRNPLSRARGGLLAQRMPRALDRWPWARRRAWLVAVCVLAGALGGFAAGSLEPARYGATAVLVVQSSASTAAAASADGAEELAITYAALVPDDESLLSHIGAEMGISATAAGHDLSVQAVSGTALVDVRFTTTDPARAVKGANDVARALSTSVHTGSAIAPGTMSVVSLARSAAPSGSLRHYGLPIGVLLGLVVGCGAVLIAERTDRRVDDVETLGEAARCPATKRPGGLSSGELVQAIERSTPGPLTVVPLQREEVGGAAELCRSIASTKAEPVVRMSTPFVTAPTSSAARSGPTVLVVGAGASMKSVQDAAGRLRVLGRAPAWAVLVPPARRRRDDGS